MGILPNIAIDSDFKLTKIPIMYYDYGTKQSSEFFEKIVIKISAWFRNCLTGNNKEETE